MHYVRTHTRMRVQLTFELSIIFNIFLLVTWRIFKWLSTSYKTSWHFWEFGTVVPQSHSLVTSTVNSAQESSPHSFGVITVGSVMDTLISMQNKIASSKRKLGCASAMILLQRIAILNGVFCCGRWASDRGSRCANVNMVIEWKGILAEGTVVWND